MPSQAKFLHAPYPLCSWKVFTAAGEADHTSAFKREVNTSNNSANPPSQATAAQKDTLLCHFTLHLCSVKKRSHIHGVALSDIIRTGKGLISY